MTRFAGLDGIPGAWVVVWIAPEGHSFHRLERITDLAAHPLTRAAIDIPIGVPERDDRGCDVAAKKLLGKHWPRVFTGVRRWILEQPSVELEHYHAINRLALAKGESRITLQMFYILNKIREVDDAMPLFGQDRLIESHPELVFLRLNKGEPVPPKKKAAGRDLRRALLKRVGFSDIDAWLGMRKGTGIRSDDLLDACACAIAARDSKHYVPTKPLRDPRGLKMTINY